MKNYFNTFVSLILLFIAYQTFMMREEMNFAHRENSMLNQFAEETYFNTNELEERLEKIENQLLLLENITRNVR